MKGYLRFLLLGLYFGLVLTKAQVISAFKIRAMFLFREPDLYLIIGSAVAVGALGVFLIKRFRLRTLSGETARIAPKAWDKGVALGGFLFGLGWFVTGTCPGPIYAQLGAGEAFALFTLAGALIGTWLYALLEPKLPR